MIKPGDIVQERYAVVRPLGSGGFGAVFLATDSRLGNRQIALKYFATAHMRPDEAAQAAQLFQSEAHTLANLNHPNLTPVLDYFDVSDGWVLVMAYVPGDSLATLQKRLNGPFGEHQVIDWAIELCTVLDYLHRQRPPLVFRDLKPSNIMRTPDGKLMLIDFGIVRTFKEGQHQDTVQMGTPGYAPPEQYGGQTEPRSDLYSLGATMYVLLTGERLTGGLLIPSVRERSPDVSPALDDLVRRMTALRPQERPASALAVRSELEQIRADSSSGAFVANPFAAADAAVSPQPNAFRSTSDEPTRVNPALPARPTAPPVYQPQAAPVQNYVQSAPQTGQNYAQSAPPAQNYAQPAQIPAAPIAAARRGNGRWGLVALLVLLLGGAGAAYALRDRVFGGADVGVATALPAAPDALLGTLIVTSRDNADSGPYSLLEIPLQDGIPRSVVPNHDDTAIADRRRSDGRIVYSHGVVFEGKLIEQIFSINADGSDERQLSSGGSLSRAPRWSPDGKRIAFESTRDVSGDNPRDIYIMNADGSNVQRITAEAGWQGGPAWSPDGTQLVFHSKTGERYELALLKLASGEQFTLAAVPGEDTFWPDWSPDGGTVAFMTGSGDSTAIYTVAAGGGTPRKLTNLGAGTNRWPRWSPDGRYLAFESQRNNRWQVYIQTLADGSVRKISDGTRNDRWPNW